MAREKEKETDPLVFHIVLFALLCERGCLVLPVKG